MFGFDICLADVNVFVWSCLVQQSPKMEGTVFAPALKELEHVRSEHGEILTKHFLEVCKHILPVLGVSCSLPCYLLLKERNNRC